MSTPHGPDVFNLLDDLPGPQAEEAVATLLARPGVRLERIVSYGQASPPDAWFDQDEDEWVMLVTGRARLQIEGEARPHELAAGDCVFLPAHVRHRVAWTDPDWPTVWLALILSAP